MMPTIPEKTDYSPLLQNVAATHGYDIVSAEYLDDFAAAEPLVMLFVAGDHWRLAESNDVAAVLPQLDNALGGHARVLVAERADERALQRRYRFASFPALIFLRCGEYLGAIEGIRDWSDYLVEIPAILESEPTPPPPFQMPAGCGGSATA